MSYQQNKVRIDVDFNGQLTEMEIKRNTSIKQIIEKLIIQNCCDSLTAYFSKYHRSVGQQKSFKLSSAQQQLMSKHIKITTINPLDSKIYGLETMVSKMILKQKIIKIKIQEEIQQLTKAHSFTNDSLAQISKHEDSQSEVNEHNGKVIKKHTEPNLQHQEQGSNISLGEEKPQPELNSAQMITQDINYAHIPPISQSIEEKLQQTKQIETKRILLTMQMQDGDQNLKKKLKVNNSESLNYNRQNILFSVEDIWQNWSIKDQLRIFIFDPKERQLPESDLERPLNQIFGNADQVKLRILRKKKL